MSKHLPLLFNPLLNALFNNPQHDNSPFKNTIADLVEHNDFTILLPPSYILNDAYDPNTSGTIKLFLKDLCYTSEDFIRSHIIRSSNPVLTPSGKTHLIVYNTLNHKQILIKNGMVFTGRGFKKSLRLNILGVGQFHSFCDYFPKGSRFMIIYIEDTLIGSNFLNMVDYIDQKFLPEPPTPQENSKSVDTKKDYVTFEMLLRSVPLLLKLVSEKYYKLFHHNNQDFHDLRTQTRKSLSFIKEEFHRMVDQAYVIILESIKEDNPESEKTYHLIQNLLNSNPEIDLNKLVYEYVELNLYDKIWSQLVFQFNCDNADKQEFDKEAFKVLTTEKYGLLSCVLLNHLDIPVYEPWNINLILKRVSLAIEIFSKLDDSSVISQASKRDILMQTIEVLTETTTEIIDEKSQELVVDADTLVGMLIMVIIHSKVENLEAHLYYIRNFQSSDQSRDGYFSYIVSNLDAVIYHLSNTGDFGHLVELSLQNYEFWASIQRQDTEIVKKMVADILNEFPGELPANHFIKSRNIHGESCLMFAIKAKNYEIFELLVDSNEDWFTIEELLFDRNTTTGQNLLMVSLIEETPAISQKIVEILLSMEEGEQIAYLNLTDFLGRSVGHYLFHDTGIMQQIGHLIDWELKDTNHHTPLFSTCRCYDHQDYLLLIETGFKSYFQKYKTIDLDDHMDKLGNTLLHVILKGLDRSQLLDHHVDVNQFNNKSMSPLTIYVKYNRLHNLGTLLQCETLNFLNEEPKNFYNVFDYLSFLASKPTSNSEDFKKIQSLIYNFAFENYFPSNQPLKILATNGRYDSGLREWIIFFKVMENENRFTVFQSFSKLKLIFQLFELKNPFMGLPTKEDLWINYNCQQSIPFYSKYKINRFIHDFNQYLVALSLYSPNGLKEFYSLFKDNNLTLDIMKQISKDQELIKRKMGEVTLTIYQISEIETFLSYSLTDLQAYDIKLTKLYKLFTMYNMKSQDARIVHDRFLGKIFTSEVPNTKFKWVGEEEETSNYTKLGQSVLFLQFSNNQMTKKIQEILTKLEKWKQVYGRIKCINDELRRYENKVHDHITPVTSPDLQRRDLNEGLLEPVEEPESPVESSFFSFGLENKKLRYKRLLLLKNDEIKTIINLNLEIKYDHELVASEISNFLTFKSNFVLYSFKQFTQLTIQGLKLQNRGDGNFQKSH